MAKVWRKEDDGMVTITVTSDGTTGEQWSPRLESRGERMGDYAEDVLRSFEFRPTTGLTYTLKVLPGHLYADDERVMSTIRADAKRRKLTTPNAEVACLLRDVLTDAEIKAMGLYEIVIMHEPIEDSDPYRRHPRLLCVSREGYGRWLRAHYGYPHFKWLGDQGFVFEESRVKS